MPLRKAGPPVYSWINSGAAKELQKSIPGLVAGLILGPSHAWGHPGPAGPGHAGGWPGRLSPVLLGNVERWWRPWRLRVTDARPDRRRQLSAAHEVRSPRWTSVPVPKCVWPVRGLQWIKAR